MIKIQQASLKYFEILAHECVKDFNTFFLELDPYNLNLVDLKGMSIGQRMKEFMIARITLVLLNVSNESEETITHVNNCLLYYLYEFNKKYLTKVEIDKRVIEYVDIINTHKNISRLSTKEKYAKKYFEVIFQEHISFIYLAPLKDESALGRFSKKVKAENLILLNHTFQCIAKYKFSWDFFLKENNIVVDYEDSL